ncbi:MAG: hypothetical protein PHS57_08165 [Alphaproteobacteria bacterium]|nr:hypothetical protein [Alphaproteobacteria bacterium]
MNGPTQTLETVVSPEWLAYKEHQSARRRFDETPDAPTLPSRNNLSRTARHQPAP